MAPWQHDRGAHDRAAHHAARTQQAHRTLHLAARRRDAFALKLMPDLVGAVDLQVGLPDALGVRYRHRVALRPHAQRLWVKLMGRMAPIGRRGNLRCPGDRHDPKGDAVLFDEGLHGFRQSSSA